MDSFELNKIMGAILATCLILLSLNIAAGAIFAPHKPAKPGYEIAVPETQAEPGKPAAPSEPLPSLLAKADLKRGEASSKKCLACHSLQKGGPNLVGPHLWGIVNRPKHEVGNFNYSPAMRSQTGNWTLDELNVYLTNPKAKVPGTAMNFPGIPRDTERADLLAYLNQQSDSPAPLPPPAASTEAPAGQGGQGTAAPPNKPQQPQQQQQPAQPKH